MGNGHRSDRELNGLRGPVKTCSERSIYAPETFPKDLAPKVAEHNKTSDGFMVSALSVCTVEYDRDGKTLTIHRANPDGSALSTTYTYDADGRLLKITDDRSGRPTKTIYSCDETNSGVNNTAGFQYQEHHDEQGRKTTILSVPPTPHGTAVCYLSSSPLSCLPEYAVIHPRVPSGGSSITFYNERDQATEAQVHDLHGNRVGRVLASYDADGRLTEEREISADFGEVSSTLFTYDSQNRLTQKRHRFYTIIGPVERVTIVTYNEYGDKVKESTSCNKSPETRTFRHDYQYDSYGNWTEQTITHSLGFLSTTHRTQRELTYY